MQMGSKTITTELTSKGIAICFASSVFWALKLLGSVCICLSSVTEKLSLSSAVRLAFKRHSMVLQVSSPWFCPPAWIPPVWQEPHDRLWQYDVHSRWLSDVFWVEASEKHLIGQIIWCLLTIRSSSHGCHTESIKYFKLMEFGSG